MVARLEASAFRLHVGSLVLAAVVLFRVNRSQWFYADEWSFLSYARDALPWWDELLTPHNGHLSALPVVEYQVLRAVFGLQSYWPYITVLLVAHLILVHLLWRVIVSVGTDRLIATGLAGAFAIVGAGWENLLWAFQIGSVGALACGLGATLLANHRDPSPRRDLGAVVATTIAMLFSGVGVLMCGVVVLVGLLRGSLWRGVRLGALPTLLWVVWRLSFSDGLYPEPAYSASSLREFADGIGPYVIRGLFGSMDRFLFDVPGLGTVAILALAVFGVRTAGRVRTEAAAAYALAAGGVGFLALTGYTRLKLGIDQAASARYSYVVLALLAPLGGVALTRLSSRRSLLVLVASGMALALAAHNVQLLRGAAAREAAGKAGLRQTILAGAEIARDRTQPIIPHAVPEPVLSGALTMADLRRFALNGDLPVVAPAPVASVLTAAAYVQVAFEPHSARGGGETRCRTVAVGDAARLETSVGSARAVVSSDGPATFHLQLLDPASGASGAPRAFSLSGDSADLVVLRPSAVAFIGPQDRAIRVCGGGAKP